jgi:hypothetical protein
MLAEKIINTSDFELIPVRNNRLEIRNDKPTWILPLVIYLICLLYLLSIWNEPGHSIFYYGFFLLIIILFIVSICVLMSKKPELVIDDEGILIRFKGKYKWKEIEKTELAISFNGENIKNFTLIINTQNKKIETALDLMDKDYKEIAGSIEYFKRKKS